LKSEKAHLKGKFRKVGKRVWIGKEIKLTNCAREKEGLLRMHHKNFHIRSTNLASSSEGGIYEGATGGRLKVK